VKRAAGNLQHALMLRQQLTGLPPEQRQVEDVPLGLDASIASAWEGIAIDPRVVDGIGILCAARDGLTLDELSASTDKTLKVWDLATHACRVTHRGDAAYQAVAVTATTVIAGDAAGIVWFLDWPWSQNPQRIARDRSNEQHRLASALDRSSSPPRSAMKHTILYVAANPLDTTRLALDEECAAIERELRMATGRDDFDFRSKWAVSVDELMRHLNELEPTILHFSGHGSTGDASATVHSGEPRRDIAGAGSTGDAGILLQDGQSRQYVSDRALAKLITSAAPSTRVVVLNACYSAQLADSLRHEVDCVVGIDDAIADTAARSFAVAFYRALGHRRSIGNAVDQAAATLEAKHPGARPLCAVRDGLHADRIFLPSVAHPGPDPDAPPPRVATGKHDPYGGSTPIEAGPMTREELLTRLSRLLPAQFEQVLYLARIPQEHIPAATAAQAMRAIDVMRYAEQLGQLDHLTRIVHQVLGGGAADPRPR
jgi:riboflavin biosynthesis pyrimidine reductase